MKILVRLIAVFAIAMVSLAAQGKTYYTGKGYVELQNGLNANFDRLTFYEDQCAHPVCAGVIHIKEIATKTVSNIRADEIKELRITTYPNFHLRLKSGREGEFAFFSSSENRDWPPRLFVIFMNSERTFISPGDIKAIVLDD